MTKLSIELLNVHEHVVHKTLEKKNDNNNRSKYEKDIVTAYKASWK